MPTYEYVCKSCGEHVEVVQSFREDPLTTCSSCGGELRKVFGSIGIVFKGSGFYKTDSRSAAASGGASKADDSKSETKSDAKPEKKSDAPKGDAKGDAKAPKSDTKAAASS